MWACGRVEQLELEYSCLRTFPFCVVVIDDFEGNQYWRFGAVA